VELLKSVDLISRFDHIIGGDDIKNGKPAPDIFLKAAGLNDTKPENCLVLEDSETGAEAAWRAGMRIIVVPDMYEPNVQTVSNVSAICKDLIEAAKTIKSII
jgi:beta-phosphoglucomutase-like phosphatase (HAD superfamily)